MAIKRVQTPFAASERSIRRLERAEEEARKQIQRQESRAFDERMRQRRAERQRSEQIRRKAGLAEEDAQMRRDLIQSLAKGQGVGMFGAKIPRINKFILHAGTEAKDEKGNIIRTNELGFDPVIDPEHIARLRSLASVARDEQAADALALQGAGKLPKRTENVLSDLASDDFPAFTRMAQQATAAVPDEPMPDPITGGEFVPPVGMGGPGPTGDIQQAAIQPAPAAPSPDIDLTELLQTGTLGPQPGPLFQPGFQQGFEGPAAAATPIQNIHEIIARGGLTGKQQQVNKKQHAAFYLLVAVFRSIHHAL